MELVHFNKHSPTTRERKAPQGENLRLFRLETHFKREILPIDDHNQGIFSPHWGTFFQISKLGRGDLPLPPLSPSSYMPEYIYIYMIYIYIYNFFLTMLIKI